MPDAPVKLTIRVYQVGFGDCFLLTFGYRGGDERHVLIDFGSFPTPPELKGVDVRIARDVRTRTGGKLHAVLVSHRHADHLNGFKTEKKGNGSGDIIRSLEPDVVVQPWTEDPKARTNARKQTTVIAKRQRAYFAALDAMAVVAEAAVAEAVRLRDANVGLANELSFIGEDNLSNANAVRNLMAMAQRKGATGAFVNYGSRSGLERVLPGVTVHVLGPPTLIQSDAIRKQRRVDNNEFWQLHQTFWRLQERTTATRGRRDLRRGVAAATAPAYTRWLRERLRDVRGEELLELVRALDKQMNNTSVILLFEVGGQRLLFGGDAQIENWEFALSQAKAKRLLRGVTFYKVGHHGSLNATPKESLWPLLTTESTRPRGRRLRSVVSTWSGAGHGSVENRTEVPRRTLLAALKKAGTLFSTEKDLGRKPWKDIDIPLGG